MSDLNMSALDTATPGGPLQVCPAAGQDWHELLAANREKLLQELSAHGAILFRGFAIRSAQDFEAFAGALVEKWMDYKDRASKRSLVAGKVYTSTDTPNGFRIQLHNESSFTSRWPGKIFFYCQKAAAQGGRTPIADSRKIYQTLPAELRAPFEEHGVMYVRNFGEGVGMDWRDVFQVETREELEQYCTEAAIQFTWLDQDRLRTIQTRPASLRHPLTNEAVWFNHAMALHVSSLDLSLRDVLMRQHGEENLPHNTYYGNGQPIDDDTMGRIRQAYEGATTLFEWQAGDVLMLDNLLYAHGREAYSGERKVFAAMADPGSWSACGYALELPKSEPLTSVNVKASGVATAVQNQETVSALEDWFLDAVARELQLASVQGADNFVDMGGDSLSAVALLEDSCEKFGVEIDLDVFLSAETLDAILAALRAELEAN